MESFVALTGWLVSLIFARHYLYRTSDRVERLLFSPGASFRVSRRGVCSIGLHQLAIRYDASGPPHLVVEFSDILAPLRDLCHPSFLPLSPTGVEDQGVGQSRGMDQGRSEAIGDEKKTAEQGGERPVVAGQGGSEAGETGFCCGASLSQILRVARCGEMINIMNVSSLTLRCSR